MPKLNAMQQALELHRVGQYDRAELAYREIIDRDAGNADAYNLLGMLLSGRGEEANAQGYYERAVELYPNNVTYLLNYAASLSRSGAVERGHQVFARTIILQPHSAETNARYGLFLAQLGRYAEAEPLLLRSVEYGDSDPALWVNLGTVQRRLGKTEAAVASFRKAVVLDEGLANAWNSLGEALQAMGEKGESVSAFRQALALAPDDGKTMGNLAVTLHRMGQLQEATELLENALRQNPRDASLLCNLAALYRDSCRIDDALRRFREVLSIESKNPSFVSKYLYSLNFSPRISARDGQREHLMVGDCYVSSSKRREPRTLVEDEPLKVALLSGDFCAHSVAYFLLHLLEADEPRKVHYYCYAEGASSDSVNRRFREATAGWRDTTGRSAVEVRGWMNQDGIDVVIDLAGHTAGARLDIVAECEVPLAINWLGYPNRVGLGRFDGRIVDSVTDPEEANPIEELETLVRLDGCFLAYRSPYELPEVAPPPCTTSERFVYASFNNAAKINDSVVALWSRVLLDTPGSVLLLKSWQFGDESFGLSMRRRFEEHGVEGERILFAGRTDSYAEHMALYGKVDVALDPFPYNGTTTTCEALWMGVPVVGLQGDRHAARVGASLLRASGMGSWIAESEDEYVALARRAFAERGELAIHRKTQRERVESSVLGDVEGFRIRFEGKLRELYQNLETSVIDQSGLLDEAIGLHRRGELEEALRLYKSVLKKDPNNAVALHAAGVAHYARGEFSESERLLSRAVSLLPKRADMLTHWGSALQVLGRAEEAIEAHERALALNPSDAVTLSNYGNALTDAGRVSEALHIFKRSLDAHAENPSAWINYSVALKECGKYLEAVEAARQAVTLAADANALGNLASILVMIGESTEAVVVYQQAVILDPGNAWLRSNLVYAMQYSEETDTAALAAEVNGFGKLFESVAEKKHSRPRSGEALRIGFVSGDLRQHAVARFLRPLLRERPVDTVEIYLYSDSRNVDSWSESFEALCTGWRGIHGKSDTDVASLIEKDGVDFLIDLGGHSSRNRLSLFAMRPAPVQATWLGFPGSTGLKAMDYRIADEIALGVEESSLYPETPLLLPNGFHTIEFAEAGPVAPTPSLGGKPFTFGSFNNLAKVGKKTIGLWSELLRRTPQSRLLLKAVQLKDPAFRGYMLSKFEDEGIDPGRIALAEPVTDYASHLERYAEVDLCLDPYPYNGTTTTCEALMMGVPTVTLLGDRLCSRVGASLLTEVGLDAFICESEEEYVSVAASWVGRSKELDVLRQRIRNEMLRSALGDASRFAKTFFAAVEKAYADKVPSVRLTNWIEKVALGEWTSDGEVEYPVFRDFVEADLSGKRVLDASCVDGYWAVESLKRGASEVVCLAASGFGGETAEGEWVAHRSDYVAACRAGLGVGEERLRLVDGTLYELDTARVGTFDWALLQVNANQLRHPLLAFDRLRALCGERLLVSIIVDGGETESSGLALREGPFWIPSLAGLDALLRCAGFTVDGMELHALEDGLALALVSASPVAGGAV